MPIYELTVLKTEKITMFVCPACKAPTMPTLGVTDRPDLRHLLICSKCFRTLGEWLTLDERDKEMRDFAAKLHP